MQKQRLKQIEEYILDLFEKRRRVRLLAKEIFESTDEYANADLVRAFEDLEKRWRLIVRYTDEGDDWVLLTPEGASRAGIDGIESEEKPEALPHPPKSST